MNARTDTYGVCRYCHEMAIRLDFAWVHVDPWNRDHEAFVAYLIREEPW